MNAESKARLDIRNLLQRAECLYSEQEIDAAIKQMAEEITIDLRELNPVVLCVMNGGMIFTAKLIQCLHFALQLDYLHCTRYQNSHQGSAQLKWLAKPSTHLEGRHILVADDILDEGLTLKSIIEYCQQQGAASVSTAVLVEKKREQKQHAVTANYQGLECPDRYIFGCGMDTESYWRNLPAIYAFKEA